MPQSITPSDPDFGVVFDASMQRADSVEADAA